MKIKFPN